MAKFTHTLRLTVLPDGKVDMVLFTGRERIGQRLMVAPWPQALEAVAPAQSCRVLVRAASAEATRTAEFVLRPRREVARG